MRVHQNKPDTKNGVCHMPLVIEGFPDRLIRWVIMPVNTGAEASPESLGSNYVQSRCA